MSEYIKRPAHVALEVPDLEASVAWATTVMGLRETERVDGVSYLTHSDCHHSLQYIASDRSALHHVVLQAHDHSALDGLQVRLREAEIKIISTEPEEGVRRDGEHRRRAHRRGCAAAEVRPSDAHV